MDTYVNATYVAHKTQGNNTWFGNEDSHTLVSIPCIHMAIIFLFPLFLVDQNWEQYIKLFW